MLRHHQHVGLLHGGKFLLYRVMQLRAPQRAGKMRCQGAEFDQMLFARHRFADQGHQVLRQGSSLGGALQATGDGNDAERMWRVCSHVG